MYSIEEKLRFEKTKLLLSNGWINTSTLFISVFIVAYFYRSIYEPKVFYIWLIILVITALFRISTVVSFNKKISKNSIKINQSNRYMYEYSFSSLFISILLGFAMIYLNDKSQLHLKAFLICFACGFIAGGSFVYASFRNLSIAYSVILSVFVLWANKDLTQEWNQEVFIFCIIYLVAILKSMITYNELINKNLYKSFSLKSTTKQLELKNQQLDQKLKELETEKKKVIHSSRLAALGEMSGSMAHEINTPLAVMKTSSAIIKRELKQDEISKDKIINRVDKINLMIDRIVKVIQSLQKFSRTDNQEIHDDYSIKNILDETLILANEKIKTRGIELINNFDKSNDFKINCNFIQISQVFLNIINNAVDVLEETKDGKWIKIEVQKKISDCVIEISNDGQKISTDIASKVFDQFFTTKSYGKGTGIGMSISKEIILDHNGSIEILKDSEYTTFRIQLPI